MGGKNTVENVIFTSEKASPPGLFMIGVVKNSNSKEYDES